MDVGRGYPPQVNEKAGAKAPASSVHVILPCAKFWRCGAQTLHHLRLELVTDLHYGDLSGEGGQPSYAKAARTRKVDLGIPYALAFESIISSAYFVTVVDILMGVKSAAGAFTI